MSYPGVHPPRVMSDSNPCPFILPDPPQPGTPLHALPETLRDEDGLPYEPVSDVLGELGVRLTRQGLWADREAAGRLWRWLRHLQIVDLTEWGYLVTWLGGLLEFRPGRQASIDWLHLGFQQGACCAAQNLELPEELDVPPPAGLARTVGEPFPLDGRVLESLREWMAGQAAYPGMPRDPLPAWTWGVSLGWRLIRQGSLGAGSIAAAVDALPPVRRFAGQALARFLHQPHPAPWAMLVRSLYPAGSGEGEALAASVGRSLYQVGTSAGRLRELLLDAVTEGRRLVIREPARVRDILEAIDEEELRDFLLHFDDTSGPLREPADPVALFPSLAGWLAREHEELVPSWRRGDALQLLAEAYRYCWWRGLYEGLVQSRPASPRLG